MNARTHSTCFGSLEEVLMNDQGCATPLDVLVLIFLDQSITIEFCFFLDILDERPRLGLLRRCEQE